MRCRASSRSRRRASLRSYNRSKRTPLAGTKPSPTLASNTLGGLFELTELELREVFTDKDFAWNKGVVEPLRKRVNNSALGFPLTGPSASLAQKLLLFKPVALLNLLPSLQTRAQRQPFRTGREVGSALVSPIVPVGLAKFARLLHVCSLSLPSLSLTTIRVVISWPSTMALTFI